MIEKQISMTASEIRYLLAIGALERENGVRITDIAENIGVTKPSVIAMVNILAQKGYAVKEKYGKVYLTADGRAIADKYSKCQKRLCEKLHNSLGLPIEDCLDLSFLTMEKAPADMFEMLQAEGEENNANNNT